jgi:hypothetical protein
MWAQLWLYWSKSSYRLVSELQWEQLLHDLTLRQERFAAVDKSGADVD